MHKRNMQFKKEFETAKLNLNIDCNKLGRVFENAVTKKACEDIKIFFI